jgi:hypothetical protein
MKRKWTILGALAATLLFTALAAAAPGSHDIDWWVMGGGGGSGASGSITLDGTIGQATVGAGSSESYVICTGFWYGLGECIGPPRFSAYLPVILRNFPSE